MAAHKQRTIFIVIKIRVMNLQTEILKKHFKATRENFQNLDTVEQYIDEYGPLEVSDVLAKPLTPDEIIEGLFSDVEQYKEDIENLVRRGLSYDRSEFIYWDAWFRGAEGKSMNDAAERGIQFNGKNSG